MKKNLFFFAAAALALASCSSDETVLENESLANADVIEFRALTNGLTRAANGTGLKTTWETGDILYVTAQRGTAKFFQDQFVKDATGFNSATKHYWPSDLGTTNVTFDAFWGAVYKTWAADGDGKSLAAAYTVPDAVASQKDLLYARKTISSKPSGAVTLNFRHMLSQIVVKVANDQANLEVNVTGVRVGYLNKVGTFTYDGGVTDTQVEDATNTAGATLIDKDNWTKTDDGSKNATYKFEQTVTSTNLAGVTSAKALTGFSSWILMPQALSAATAYTDGTKGSAGSDPKLNGAYLALEMVIIDKDTDAPIVAKQWCYWPIGTTWNPGYRYTYTINVGSGGYQPCNVDATVATTLDPVLDGAAIWFSPLCTIDEWVDANYGVSSPIARTASYAYTASGSETINLDAGANGTYTFTITGLTAGNSITASATGNFTASPTVSDSGTVPASGQITITGTLSANTTAAASSVITITNTTSSTSMTITINQAAPTN